MFESGLIWILKWSFWTKPYLVLTCETIMFPKHQYAALFDYCRADWLRFFSLGFLQSTTNSCMFTILQLAGQIYEMLINIFWIYRLTFLTVTHVGCYKQNPRILIYVYHWGLLFLIAVAFLHIQVYSAHGTRQNCHCDNCSYLIDMFRFALVSCRLLLRCIGFWPLASPPQSTPSSTLFPTLFIQIDLLAPVQDYQYQSSTWL